MMIQQKNFLPVTRQGEKSLSSPHSSTRITPPVSETESATPAPTPQVLNPAFNLNRVKAIVWDMDGTLYALPWGFQYIHYALEVSRSLPEEQRSPMLLHVESALRGKSPFTFGRYYDPSTNLLLEVNGDFAIEGLYTTSGARLKQEVAESLYPRFSRESTKEMVGIGDGWEIVEAIATRWGVSKETLHKAYDSTKDYMHSHPQEFHLTPDPDVTAFFQYLKAKGYTVIVATNSDLKDTRAVLERLGIVREVDEVYPRAGKPENTKRLFQEILETHHLRPEDVLAIGDNVRNDILDPAAMGIQTIFIDQLPGQKLYGVDVRVSGLKEIIALFLGRPVPQQRGAGRSAPAPCL